MERASQSIRVTTNSSPWRMNARMIFSSPRPPSRFRSPSPTDHVASRRLERGDLDIQVLVDG